MLELVHGLAEKTDDACADGCINTFTMYIASKGSTLLNTRFKQLFALVADWTTCEKPLFIEKFRNSSWIPSTGTVIWPANQCHHN